MHEDRPADSFAARSRSAPAEPAVRDDVVIGSTLRQTLSLPLALAFAVGLLGGSYGYHGCPRHAETGHLGPDPERAAATRVPAASRPAGDDAGPTVDHGADRDDGGDEGPSFCICISACHAGAASVHPAPAAVQLPSPALGPDTHRRITRGVPPRELPAYFLPYALGPPAA